MTSLRDLGEFAFIKRIADLVGDAPNVIEGIGDDCAVLQSGNRVLLVTADLSVENVHFRLAGTAPEDIGWKAVVASLSDVAAMGGIPQFVLVTAAAPRDTNVETLEAIARGVANGARAHGAVVVGGDTTRSIQGIVIDTIVIGEAPDGRYLTRRGARAGDQLLVTGFPGRSAAGLHAQEHGNAAPELVRSHHCPNPRLKEGRWLAKQEGVHAMIDVSDGLVQDAAHIARLSNLGVDIDSAALPIDGETRLYCGREGLNAVELTLQGGEAYELAFAVAADKADPVRDRLENDFGRPCAIVGTFLGGSAEVRVDGAATSLLGFDHFRDE